MSEMAEARGEGWLCWLLGNRAGDSSVRWALVPLRLMIGVIFFVHGAQKAFGWFGGGGFKATAEMLGGLGFPATGLFAVLLVLAELVGGIMLIVGLAPRVAAIAIAVTMIVAMFTAHRGGGFLGTHLQQMIIAGCVTVLIAGSGALSLQRGSPEGEAEEGFAWTGPGSLEDEGQ